jgi:hypothetical protein
MEDIDMDYFFRRHFLRSHHAVLLALMLLASLLTFGCQKNIAPPSSETPPNDHWSSTWSYTTTPWYPAVSAWLTASTDITEHTTSSLIHLRDNASRAILSACKTHTHSVWMKQRLSLYFKDSDGILTNDSLNYHIIDDSGVSESISASEYHERQSTPKIILLSQTDLNNDCAAIAVLVAFHKNNQPSLINLSNNLISNKGAAYIQQIVQDLAPQADHNIKINLVNNVQLGALGKHYLQNLPFDNVRIDIDHVATDNQKAALARAIALDVSTKPTSSQQSIQYIGNFDKGSKGVKALVNLLSKHKSIKEISLINNEALGYLDWSGAIALAEIIRLHPNLTNISIYNQPIGDRGVKALTQSLKTDHHDFHLLNISKTDISDTALNSIATLPHRKSFILIIDNNPKVSMKAISKLSKKHPEWLIIH